MYSHVHVHVAACVYATVDHCSVCCCVDRRVRRASPTSRCTHASTRRSAGPSSRQSRTFTTIRRRTAPMMDTCRRRRPETAAVEATRAPTRGSSWLCASRTHAQSACAAVCLCSCSCSTVVVVARYDDNHTAQCDRVHIEGSCQNVLVHSVYVRVHRQYTSAYIFV